MLIPDRNRRLTFRTEPFRVIRLGQISDFMQAQIGLLELYWSHLARSDALSRFLAPLSDSLPPLAVPVDTRPAVRSPATTPLLFHIFAVVSVRWNIQARDRDAPIRSKGHR